MFLSCDKNKLPFVFAVCTCYSNLMSVLSDQITSNFDKAVLFLKSNMNINISKPNLNVSIFNFEPISNH